MKDKPNRIWTFGGGKVFWNETGWITKIVRLKSSDHAGDIIYDVYYRRPRYDGFKIVSWEYYAKGGRYMSRWRQCEIYDSMTFPYISEIIMKLEKIELLEEILT